MLRHAWIIAALVAAPLAAQKSGPQGDTWETIAKLPDFGGLWEVTFGGGPRGGGEPPQFTPEYAAKLKLMPALPWSVVKLRLFCWQTYSASVQSR